jgi:hypothetical protein
VKASELRPNPRNWRRHPTEQAEALRGLLDDVGFAGAVLARETPDGLELIDGHLRTDLAGDAIIPVLVLDVTEAEADKLLATFDPIGAMATSDAEDLASLLETVETENKVVQELLQRISGPISEDTSKLVPLSEQKPPAISWVLIGIPTVRFCEISSDIEKLSLIDEIVIETTVNDG